MTAESTALLLAGQGSERVGMGADLAAVCGGCRETFALAEQALGQPLSRWMAEGPQDVLRRTEVAQPALLALGVAQGEHLRLLGVEPVALAGHSLGQYTALVLAGALGLADAVRLVAARGRLMQRTVPRGRGAMVAVAGLTMTEVAAACATGRTHGVVDVACFNAPGRLVLSGETAAVAAAAAACWEAGGGTTDLPVSAPFHCELLAPMVPEFAGMVAETPVAAPRVPVVDNVTACPLRDAEAVRQSLVDQIVAPVLFEESLKTLAQMGVQRFIGCGPGAAALKFASLTTPEIRRVTFDDLTAAHRGVGGAHVGSLRP
ncbi:ACP S-malonyltransferase [Actinokineospora sp.]|uniref:ACP S-malonyltransferase n=1 Tax=Actinokineospora sp. TaxID=1872133 RepID=UPI004037EB75